MTQRRRVFLSEAEGKPAICFDTGLEPRSFARTKMSQNLIEKGYIVHPDGSHEEWVSSGVCEHENQMRVWGKPFEGERLDIFLNKLDASNDAEKQAALQAIISWIKARMILGDTCTTLNPAAAFVDSGGSVFFAPPNLANRCLYAEGMELDYFNCPDLTGMNAAAFCAAAMLYKFFFNTLPYSGKETLYQDMREGVFLPPRLASSGLNKELCSLIQSALFLPVKSRPYAERKEAHEIMTRMLDILFSPSIYNDDQLSAEERQKREKEKKKYLTKRNIQIKTSRFAARNKYPLIGVALGVVFVLFIILSTMDGVNRRPTTEGMLSVSVVHTYYDSYSALDHFIMESCIQGSDPVIKGDISAAASFYAVQKTRQSYENLGTFPIMSAQAWQESGRELPAPDVFGITDLSLEHISGSEESDMMIYRANYDLWAPNEHARRRTDTLTLQRDRKNNWRITEILRTER